jgi:hypothetical protein
MTDNTHPPPARCTATAKGTGQRCRRAPIVGGTVCVKHGGGAPQVQKAARQRILDAAQDAVSTLIRATVDDNVPWPVRLAAARDLLDRAGEGAKQQIEVTTHDGDLADLDAALEALTTGRAPADT